MNFEEHAAKPLLAAAGIAVPASRLVETPDAAAAAAASLAPVVIKAQVPAGKRGKAGGIRRADDEASARQAAGDILGMEIAGHVVDSFYPVAQRLACTRHRDTPLVLCSHCTTYGFTIFLGVALAERGAKPFTHLDQPWLVVLLPAPA